MTSEQHGFNCTDKLYADFIFNKNDQLHDPLLVQSINAEPQIPRACVGLDHPWILVSYMGPGNNPPPILKDDAKIFAYMGGGGESVPLTHMLFQGQLYFISEKKMFLLNLGEDFGIHLIS